MVLFDPKTGEELDVEALKAAARPPKIGSPAGKRVNYTAKNQALLAAGIHPATGRALLTDSKCGDCVHAEHHSGGAKSFWKCAKHRLGMSRSEASDVRVGWPACTLFEQRPPEETS
jgi:hypothetical protein